MEIYLHVPYCRQKCRYCDFASFPHAESTQRAYVDAVLTEAASQAAKIPHGAMETAYLGGGTPSILPPELLTRLLEGVTAHFPLAPGAEFTSEANPGTLTHAWLDAALNCGINRLSMGDAGGPAGTAEDAGAHPRLYAGAAERRACAARWIPTHQP